RPINPGRTRGVFFRCRCYPIATRFRGAVETPSAPTPAPVLYSTTEWPGTRKCPVSCPRGNWLDGGGVGWPAARDPVTPVRSGAAGSADSPRPPPHIGASLCRTRAETSAAVTASGGVPVTPGVCRCPRAWRVRSSRHLGSGSLGGHEGRSREQRHVIGGLRGLYVGQGQMR